MRHSLPSWIRDFADVRPGEGRRTALMFVYYLLVIFAYYILKPVSRALFLNNFDPDQLPWLYIFMAVLGGGGASWMSRAASHEQLTTVIQKSQLFLISNIFLIWWLLHYQSGIVLYVFSIWVGTFSIVTVGQFWLLANNLFDARSARRLFPVIGLAAVVGGILGGTFTSVLVEWVKAKDLMLACGGLVALTMLVVRALRTEEAKLTVHRREEEYHLRDTWSLFRESPHLRWISLLVGTMFIIDILVDYQFSVLAKQTYQGHELTAFLARFQGVYLNLLSLAFQLFLTGPVLRRLGIGGTLGFAPLSIVGGGLAMLIQPSIVAAAVMRSIEAAARYTFTRTGLELLYLPLPQHLKNQTKILLEISVDRFSRAAAGGLLLLCTVVMGLGLRAVAGMTLFFSGIWIGGIVLVLRSYVHTLRQAIESREVHLERARVQPWDAATRAVLERSLESPNDRQVAYALEVLQSDSKLRVKVRWASLLRRPSAEVRLATFRLLSAWHDPAGVAEAQLAANSDSLQIRAEAIHYLCQHAQDPGAKLQSFLTEPDLMVRRAALVAASEHSYERPLPVITESWIEELTGARHDNSELSREVAAAALAFADPERVRVVEHTKELLRDRSAAVANTAAKTAGEVRDSELVFPLLNCVIQRNTRTAAREALAAFGTNILPLLLGRLDDSLQPEVLRRQIPRLLADVANRERDPRSVTPVAEALLQRLPHSVIPLRFSILKALNRIRREHPEVQIPGDILNSQVLREVRHYFELLQSLQGAVDDRSDSHRLVVRSLEERLDQTLERIFRLLGLRYPLEAVYDAYRAMRGSQAQRRAAAIEFLDNLLDPALRPVVLPIVEESSSERLALVGARLLGLEPLSTEESLRRLIRGEDKWLKALAIYRAAELQLIPLQPDMQAALADGDPLVAETAARGLRHLHQHVA